MAEPAQALSCKPLQDPSYSNRKDLLSNQLSFALLNDEIVLFQKTLLLKEKSMGHS